MLFPQMPWQPVPTFGLSECVEARQKTGRSEKYLRKIPRAAFDYHFLIVVNRNRWLKKNSPALLLASKDSSAHLGV